MRNTRKSIVGLDFSRQEALKARYLLELATLTSTTDQQWLIQMGPEARESS